MRGAALFLVFVLILSVWGAIAIRGALVKPNPEAEHVKAQAEATRLAIENERAQVELYVAQGAAQARIAALQGFYTALSTVGLLVVLALAGVVLLWMYNRASLAYPKGGIYPIVIRPGLRSVAIYDPNRQPGPDPLTTTQAQAVQFAAALTSGQAPTSDRMAMFDTAGKVFLPQPRAEGLLDPPLTRSELTASHVERLLLESGVQDDDDT